MKRVGRLFFAAAALAMPVPAAAQSASVADAFQSGQVGERFDGYLGMVGTSSDELRRQVAAINLRRRNLYIDLASRRNVTAQVVGTMTACELLARVAVGQAYMLKDGAWRRRAPGQAVPVPDYCR